MIKLYENGVYLLNGTEIVEDTGSAQVSVSKEEAAKNTIAYGEPTDSYKDEEYGNTYYWYDKESYDNSCTVETDAETGLVENITLQCYE